MHCTLAVFAIVAASGVLSLPLPGNNCIGSSFSPTNCNSPGSNSINVDPDINVNTRRDPESEIFDLVEREAVPQIASSSNNNSPGANSLYVDPAVTVDVEPTINLREVLSEAEVTDLNVREAEAEPEPEPTTGGSSSGSSSGGTGGNCIGSSFSPTNCNSPGSNTINVDPGVNVNL